MCLEFTMTITVGTDTYISVADAKTLADKLSEEGEDFAASTDEEVEKFLVRAMENLNDIVYAGSKKISSQTLKFPRTHFNEQEDPDGLTVIKKVQTIEAVALSEGRSRLMDTKSTKRGGPLFEDVQLFSRLASADAYQLLEDYAYIPCKCFANQLTPAEGQRFTTTP